MLYVLYMFPHLIPTIILCGTHYYIYFISEKTEVRKG